MLSQLPAEGSVSLFFAVVLGLVLFRAGVFSAVLGTVFRVAVLFVQGLGLFPGMAFAGNRGKEQSGGSGSEERGQFHPAAGCSGSAADGKWRKNGG